MRIYKNDIIKASAISTSDDRGLLLCSITDSGFTFIAGVISAIKDKLPNKDHKKMVFEILNDTKKSTDDITIVGQKYCNKEQKTICLCNVSFSFLLKRAPACEGVRSLYLYNA